MNKLKVMAEVGNKLNPTSRAAERAKHKASKAPTATGLPANKKLRVPCHSGKAINPADVVWDVPLGTNTSPPFRLLLTRRVSNAKYGDARSNS